MLHTRCRLTPYPVNLSWYPGLNYTLYNCLPGANLVDTSDNNPKMTKSDSPWRIPQDCYWPIATDSVNYYDIRYCALPGTGGYNECPNDPAYVPESKERWCGSNYDGFGNYRFTTKDPYPPPPAITDFESNVASLFYGYISFDNFPTAFTFIFKSITQDGCVTRIF